MGEIDSITGVRPSEPSAESDWRDNKNEAAPVGEWPGPVSRWPLILSGLLWMAWAGFMLWMAVLRIESSKL